MTEKKKKELTAADVYWIVRNWDRIPDEFKENINPHGGNGLEGLKAEEHFVVLLLNRQKPSVEADYSFDEERVGVTRTGKVVWGFDSGCSCPSPWVDSFPDCYSVSKTWKQFIVQAKTSQKGESKYKTFDAGWSEEAKARLLEIKKKVRA